jgi:pimeloyl-ACP methyl ester carboxylesterase
MTTTARQSSLVVLHGGGGPEWLPAHELLAERVELIAPELPREGDTLPELAERLAAAIEPERFALLGTSFGGAVAAWLAVLHPQRVSELILDAPAAFATLPDLAPEQIGPALYAHPERRPPLPPPDPALRDRIDRVLAASDRAALEARLRELAVPTMVMFGTRDGLIAPEEGRRYKALIPNCDLVFVYDAAHAIASDRPEAYADLVGDFLERGPGHIVSRTSRVIHR